MNMEWIRNRWLGLMVIVLFLGMFGCVKRTDVAPGPAETEEVTSEPAEETPEQEVVEEEEPVLIEEQQAALKDAHFDFDRYNINPSERLILQSDYKVLQAIPNVEILVEGHCDNRGTVEYNLALGQKRAEAVKDYMVSLGMTASKISTISYGEEKPLDPGNNEAAWAKNRRAHIVILKR